ncbi:HIT family protein [Loigolactobacillus backii]|uniref:Histidine triad protein n=1 Tax=Loigolactobacillus backii TaxID=375175 RepID=A0A192H1L3_9LACO|nr:HIT family protein [Loigolactobacillus backii]ANK59286.1 histidine triad protein [Loigolactobacillus backii]ANK62699.1 histidine triad protein [Loigolactobacillus backii]ANK64278.1 histidine triad protein [Loigolactobacillus backii]ANK67328.1 histidine triad protein [Loigolactobacillus backii]ANK70293.1 histidine triad protein [Loigolactobacillus backii]
MDYDKDCIFCKIVHNEIPSTVVYEDDVVKAFLDITQATPGHTLLVPKKHVADIFDYDEATAKAIFSRIPKLARAIRDSNPNIKGMNIVNNNGKVAYQSVFHSHFHLIPRYSENDDFSMHFGDNSKAYSPARLQQVAASIKANLEG